MPAPSERPLVLVVDDEADIREVLGDLFADDGFRVVCAEDGQEALQLVAVEVPDVIVSDFRMPRLHGLELVERLRAADHLMPIVLMSTWTPPADLPGVRFVRKPFDLDAISKAIELSLASG